MPKYWREIAIDAQADGAFWSALARIFRDAEAWANFQDRAAAAYARARWAMESDECP